MMLVRLNASSQTINLLSIPRDLRVQIPEGGVKLTDRLNAAYSIGGPNLLVRVTRAYQAMLNYTDLKGKPHAMPLEGPMAELLQHEVDHLDGILAVDRATGLDPFSFRTEWEKVHDVAERYGTPKPRELP